MAEIQKERNYALDLLRVWAAVLVAFVHFGRMNFSQHIPFDYTSVANIILPEGISFWIGTCTLGFFGFTTGYWLVHAFKGHQRKSVFGKGNDMELLYRYTAKNYIAYVPLCMFAVLTGFIVNNVINGSDLGVWLDTGAWGIFEFFGLGQLGFPGTSLPYNGANEIIHTGGELLRNTPYNLGGITWYPSAIIVFAPMFFLAFMKSEKVTVFAILPVTLVASFLQAGTWFLSMGHNYVGLNGFLGGSFGRIFLLAIIGMWSWYLVDALKKVSFSKKASFLLGLFNMVLFISMFYFNRVGFYGGMFNMDLHIIIIVILFLINRDWFTNAINKIFSKLPLRNSFGGMSLGILVTHIPMVVVCGAVFEPIYGMQTSIYIYYGLLVASGIAWMILEKILITPCQKAFSNAIGLNKPLGKILKIKDEEKIIMAEPPVSQPDNSHLEKKEEN